MGRGIKAKGKDIDVGSKDIFSSASKPVGEESIQESDTNKTNKAELPPLKSPSQKLENRSNLEENYLKNSKHDTETVGIKSNSAPKPPTDEINMFNISRNSSRDKKGPRTDGIFKSLSKQLEEEIKLGENAVNDMKRFENELKKNLDADKLEHIDVIGVMDSMKACEINRFLKDGDYVMEKEQRKHGKVNKRIHKLDINSEKMDIESEKAVVQEMNALKTHEDLVHKLQEELANDLNIVHVFHAGLDAEADDDFDDDVESYINTSSNSFKDVGKSNQKRSNANTGYGFENYYPVEDSNMNTKSSKAKSKQSSKQKFAPAPLSDDFVEIPWSKFIPPIKVLSPNGRSISTSVNFESTQNN